MKNKLVFLLAVFALLFGLIFIIGKIRADKEKLRIEENNITARKQFVQDSVQESIIQKRQEAEKIEKRDKEEDDKIMSQKRRETELIESKMKEDEEFNSYINSSITNSSSNIDVSVTIIDENGNISTSVSNAIANIYNQTGKKGNTGLLRSSFVHNLRFQELYEGNSNIIERLKLSKYVDYLVLGKIAYSMQQGTLVKETKVCNASISMNIISASGRNIVKSFSFSVNGNGATESQAKEEAVQKLINMYYNEYSSL